MYYVPGIYQRTYCFKQMELLIKDITSLPAFIPVLLKEAASRKKWLFIGEVGAGKTTLIKELCAWFKVQEPVTSPTYSIINEYEYIDEKGAPAYIYHMDLYRLKRIEEALDIGIEDYLDSEDYCFIEWPELIEPILPEEVLKISIEIVNDSERKIVIL